MRGCVNKSKRAARPSRRGVLLLVVLSLLVLFALIGVTYVVVAGQFRRASVSTVRAEPRADDFQRQLDDGFLQLVRGSRNPFSSIGPHSLLEDIYGSSYYYNNQMVGDSILGTLAAQPIQQAPNGYGPSNFVTDSQFIDLSIVPEQNYLTTISQVSGFYNGCVLTMLSGPARGRSTRIVGYQYIVPAAATDPPKGILRIMPFEGLTTKYFAENSIASTIASYSAGGTVPPVSPPTLTLSLVGHKFLINGRPFSGTGYGYKPAAAGQAQLTAADPVLNKPYALLPNAAFFKPETTAFAPALPYVDLAGPGGANEDYDAADFQNPFLAQVVPPANGVGLASTNIVPSFHRPALLNYFDQATNGGPLSGNLPLYRRASLRPLKQDHPYFTGSNPAVIANTWSPITGPWDVDNDGDGVPDSVWVDLGFPVLTAKDGRQYKRLYAFMCLDLDGRVNLNAHGTPNQADPATYDQPITGPFPGGNNTPVLPHGQGYGPAEIRLADVISATFAAGRTEFQNLMLGNQGLGIEGRYGEGAMWATTGPVPGQFGGDQRLAQIKHFEFPNNYVTDFTAGVLTSYGTPCDLEARGIVALDFRGQPLFGRRAAVEWNNELNNSPYQLNLSGRGSKPAIGSSNASVSSTMTRTDNPFTVGELERVLRPHDIDSRSLPDRLLKLAPSLDGANSAVPMQYKNNRFAVTTDSFDLPSPSAVATPDMRTILNALNVPSKRGVNVVNMLAMKIIQAKGMTLPLSVANANTLRDAMRTLLPPEVINGQRLNLNRPLGNGRDDNPVNGVVDEVEESAQETTANNNVTWQAAYGNSLAFNLTDGVDVNGDGKVDATDAKLARHLQARYLFVLAMLLRDPQDYPTSEGAGVGQQLAVRRLAQWAINVVDFRDADSAMTPFEYDINPFNGWSVDGILGTPDDAGADRRVVWGCESPEAVLTETIAFHDRRTADTKYEKANGKLYDENGNMVHEPNPPENEDPTLDQTRIPQGSAFFELYCARNPSNPIAAADLYTYSTTDQKWRLDLGRLAGQDANNTNGKQSSDGKVYPVWRMVITKSRIASPNNDVRGRLTNKPDSTSLEPEQYRSAQSNGFSLLYQSTDAAVQIDRIVWFSTQAPNGHRDANLIYYNRTNNTQLLAGQYAVVGPRAVTYLGSINGNADFGAPSPQKIQLLPTVDITDPNGTSVYPTNLNTVHPPMPIVCAGAVPRVTPRPWTNTDATARVAPGANGIGIGLSISEPLFSTSSYYPEPTQANANAGGIVDAYGDLSRTASGGAGPFYKDQPLDSDPAPNPQRPLLAEGILGTGTQANYKTVFLQRLSNPLEPWDEVRNPYLTVDWLPIDLTVFNGEDSAAGKTVTPWDPDDPAPAAPRIATRQRGSPRTFNAGTSTFNLWTSLADAPPATAQSGPATNNFRRKLDSTLGFLNLPFQDSSAASPWIVAADLTSLPAPQNTEYVGDPRRPFPWLTWNNRPYTSAMEVMQVPGSSSGRLLSEFSIAPVGTPVNLYDPNQSSSYRSPWGHLLNFFHTSSAAPTPTGGSANLARILEYLEVPSRFVGTETMLSPVNIMLPATENNATDTAGRLPNRNTENALLSFFHPPFNSVSNFRDPGRVNLNTIPTAQVWHAVQNVPLDSADPTRAAAPYDQWTTFQQLDESRRGYSGAFDNNVPSEIGNPFRSAASHDLVPLQSMITTNPNPINVTLLRANGVNPTAGNVPLFGVNHNNPAGQDDMYNTDRNPYFRYQQIQRLGNLTTTRSNVFAVWVTVGFFEVQPAPVVAPATTYDPDVYPDGYQLGPELGSDSGDLQRHRGFYIIDRTIPVGFQRGDDFNTDKAVLLKRFIE